MLSSNSVGYAQPLLENPQIAVPLENIGGSALYRWCRRKNYLLGQAYDPRRCDRRRKEVRRIKARSNYNADEEVLFPGFGAFGYYGSTV
jgi:hypothetical protein